MMGDLDWFSTTFGAVPEGDVSWNKRVALAMIRAGLGVVLLRPGTKDKPVCLLSAREAKAADTAAQDEAKARGVTSWDRAKHECGRHHALTEEKHLNRKAVKELLESGANLAVALDYSERHVMVVDVDTDAERKAFLDDWAANGPALEGDVPLTVLSPGVYDKTAETWKHRNGGHLWLNVPDGVELPAKGEAKWCGCHQFAASDCKRKWSLFWTGTERYVLVPPSVRPEGPYRVVGEVLDAPEWLVSLAHESTKRAPIERTGELNNDDTDPINAWASSVSWAELLTRAGWGETGTEGCGCTNWNRPGHANPKTATAHDPGCSETTTDGGHGFLHLWTDAWRPCQKANLTKLDFVAHNWHGGDYRAAMDAEGIERKRKADDELFVLGEARPAEPAAVAKVDELEEFWNTRPVFQNIRAFAWSQFATPWPTLGAVLAYVVALTPPRVKINDASLNLFVGLVGPPGKGKNAAIKAARKWVGDMAREDRLYQRGIGSGQGVEAAFVKRVRDKDTERYELKQQREAVLSLVSEIDQITSHARQQASTLVANLRSGWMGELLGGMYKDAAKDLAVAEDTYRLCMIVGIQPNRAQHLIDDAGGGLPQRFLWMPVEDPTFPDDPRSFRPERWEWKPPVQGRDTADPFDVEGTTEHEPTLEMGLCQRARDEMDLERIANLRGTGETDELATHDTLGRLKVAAALAILDQRTEVTEEDWALSGFIFRKSVRERNRVIRRLEDEDRKRREAERVQRVETEIAVEKAKAETAVDRVSASVLKILAKSGADWLGSAAIRRKLSGKAARDSLGDALEALEASGSIEHQETERGVLYRLKGSGQ